MPFNPIYSTSNKRGHRSLLPLAQSVSIIMDPLYDGQNAAATNGGYIEILDGLSASSTIWDRVADGKTATMGA
jgi:hypothetical protein